MLNFILLLSAPYIIVQALILLFGIACYLVAAFINSQMQTND